jgi:RNA polymerase sigma factor (sigma-70 family)
MEPSNNESFEELLDAMQKGEDQAFTTFFNRHYDQLVQFASKKLGSFPLRAFDADDVAQSAMKSLFKSLRANRYEVQNSVELWRILITITKNKLLDRRRRQQTQKRGGGNVRGESIWAQAGEDSGLYEQQDTRQNMTPDAQVELLETTDLLFQRLEDDKTREVARLLLAGYRINDIAEELNCVRRTVERKISHIRELWSEVLNNKEMP